jgi:hypothetical protein
MLNILAVPLALINFATDVISRIAPEENTKNRTSLVPMPFSTTGVINSRK